MIKDLVNYPVAKLLKELGFLDACLFYFSLDGTPKEFMEDGNRWFSKGEGGRLILRPTQAQAARFLREHHQISVEPCFIKGDWDCEVWKMTTDRSIEYLQVFDSYESAYEHGLLRALNYIKYNK